jgi:DNA-directed RNA polymerase subunit RPC12/RpoP
MNHRVKVVIRCNQCGERFILRGKKEKNRIETGFKQCLCNNENDFHIDTED